MSDLLNGPNQAQAMLRRVSPEGRARAMREQRMRQQRTARLVGRVVLVALVAGAVLFGYDLAFGAVPGIAILVAAIVVLGAAIAFGITARDKPLAATHLDAAPLAALPDATALWLEREALALPAPAATLADTIAGDLAAMGPQLARLQPNEPAADAVKRLLAVELPNLIERHRSVPEPLRGKARQAGQSADDHLVSGLAIIREEVARMSERLASGDVDALATQDRFLELKYQGDAMLGSEPGA